ncbi:ARL14 effector protein-like [Tubulanus polymorphus]|uniref:ARL14 effector protein-like n=1 Tax=Tubulanus polymorphus TaxID=672921 RepID=UPI003DA4111A
MSFQIIEDSDSRLTILSSSDTSASATADNNSSSSVYTLRDRRSIAQMSEKQKEIHKLSFTNPGKFMENFNPESSAREMRKMNRRIYKKETSKRNQMYNENGLLVEDGIDLCDCLDISCPGCHFPCPKCQSEKCGVECRCNRKYVYERVEVEGTREIRRFPHVIS